MKQNRKLHKKLKRRTIIIFSVKKRAETTNINFETKKENWQNRKNRSELSGRGLEVVNMNQALQCSLAYLCLKRPAWSRQSYRTKIKVCFTWFSSGSSNIHQSQPLICKPITWRRLCTGQYLTYLWIWVVLDLSLTTQATLRKWAAGSEVWLKIYCHQISSFLPTGGCLWLAGSGYQALLDKRCLMGIVPLVWSLCWWDIIILINGLKETEKTN